MARQKYKKKINKFTSVLVTIIAICATLFYTLDKNDILSYNSILTGLGLKDNPVAEGEVSVHYIDVGQGDSELIISGDKVVLIDAGDRDYGQTVVNYLNKQNITKIDYLIGTHPHADHIGGLDDVIDNFEIGDIYMPKISDDLVPTTATYTNLLKTIQKHNLTISTCEFGEIIELGDAQLIMYPPIDDYDDLNNYSIMCEFVHGSNKFLFTGDAETEAENNLIDSGADISADVLKVGHHGSNTSSSKGFLKNVNPTICVISVGADNRYNHPSDKTIDRLSDYTNTIFRTDLVGTVVMISNNEGIKYALEKEE